MKMTVLFLEALFGLIAYDLILVLGRFKRVRALVGRWKVAKRNASPELTDEIVDAVNLACVCYPKQVLCLQRAAVTACLMRSHGVAADMVLGAQKTPFAAHAWVEVQGRPINEKPNVQTKYTVWERY
jgi:hypothetical protein